MHTVQFSFYAGAGFKHIPTFEAAPRMVVSDLKSIGTTPFERCERSTAVVNVKLLVDCKIFEHTL